MSRSRGQRTRRKLHLKWGGGAVLWGGGGGGGGGPGGAVTFSAYKSLDRRLK